jgi:hypothetical protein
MIQRILITVAGAVTAVLTIFAVEAFSHQLYPVPPGLDDSDMAAMKTYVGALPVTAFLLLIAAWVIGSLLGGFVIGKLAPNPDSTRMAYIAGVALTISSILNFIQIPHPIWVMIIGVLVFIPSVIMGYKLALPRVGK